MSHARLSSITSVSDLVLPKALDINTITETLNKIFPSLQLVPADIQRPTVFVMTAVYQCISQYIMEIPDAIYTTPPFASNTRNDTDLFTQAYPKLVIFRALSAIVEDVSSNEIEFSFLDLIAPDPVRTRFLLTTLLSYIDFTSIAAEEAHRIFTSVDERKARLESKKRIKIELTNEISRIQADALKQKLVEKEFREKMEKLELNVKETFLETKVIEEDQKDVDEVNAENENKLIELQNELKRLKSQNEVYDRDIIESPDRLIGELNELKNCLDNIQKDISMECHKKWDYKEKQKTRGTIIRSLEHLTEILNKIAERQIKGAEVEAKLTEAVDQLKLENEKCTETEQCLLKDENKISAMESEFQKEELLHQQSIQAISEHLETLRNQVQDIRRRMQDFDKGNREMQREIGKVKNDIAALYRDANADMKNLAVCLNDFLKEYLEAEKAYEKDRDRIERLKNIMILALRDWEEESIPSRSGTGKMDEGNYLKAGKAYEKDRDRIEQLKDILILALKNCEEESIPTRFGTDKMDEGNVEQSI